VSLGYHNLYNSLMKTYLHTNFKSLHKAYRISEPRANLKLNHKTAREILIYIQSYTQDIVNFLANKRISALTDTFQDIDDKVSVLEKIINGVKEHSEEFEKHFIDDRKDFTKKELLIIAEKLFKTLL
jgi:hypothetical protein